MTDVELEDRVRESLTRRAATVTEADLGPVDVEPLRSGPPSTTSRRGWLVAAAAMVVALVAGALVVASRDDGTSERVVADPPNTIVVPAPPPVPALLPSDVPDGFQLAMWDEGPGFPSSGGSMDLFGRGAPFEPPFVAVVADPSVTYPGPSDDDVEVDVNGATAGIRSLGEQRILNFDSGGAIVSVLGSGVDDAALVDAARSVAVDQASATATLESPPAGLDLIAADVPLGAATTFRRSLEYTSAGGSVHIGTMWTPTPPVLESLFWIKPETHVGEFAGRRALVAQQDDGSIDVLLTTDFGWISVHVTGTNLDDAERLVMSLDTVSLDELGVALSEITGPTNPRELRPFPGTMTPIAYDSVAGRTLAAFAWQSELNGEDVTCVGVDGASGCGFDPLPDGTVYASGTGSVGAEPRVTVQVAVDVDTVAVDYVDEPIHLLTPVRVPGSDLWFTAIAQPAGHDVRSIRFLNAAGQELARLDGPLTEETFFNAAE